MIFDDDAQHDLIRGPVVRFYPSGLVGMVAGVISGFLKGSGGMDEEQRARAALTVIEGLLESWHHNEARGKPRVVRGDMNVIIHLPNTATSVAVATALEEWAARALAEGTQADVAPIAALASSIRAAAKDK